MNGRMRSVIFGLLVTGLIIGGLSMAAQRQPDSIEEMIAQMREGGFILLAEMAGDTYRISDEYDYKSIMEKEDPVTFFLQHIESGKQFKVGYADKDSKKKDDWGEKIWEFYMWVVKQFE